MLNFSGNLPSRQPVPRYPRKDQILAISVEMIHEMGFMRAEQVSSPREQKVVKSK
jgi:hypothetical protein